MEFRINNKNIINLAELSTDSRITHPAFKWDSNPNGQIKNWNGSINNKGIVTYPLNKEKNYPELCQDITKGKLKMTDAAGNTTAIPISKAGVAPTWTRVTDLNTAGETYIIKVRRASLYNDIYYFYFYRNSNNSLVTIVESRSLSFIIQGAGAAGGPAKCTGGMWAISVDNGGGGSAGSAIVLWVYINDINDTNFHDIGKCYVGKAGKMPGGEGREIGNRVYHTGKWWFPDYEGVSGAGEKSWLELYVDDFTYHFDANGGESRTNDYGWSSWTYPHVWKSNRNDSNNLGDLNAGDKIVGGNITFRLIANVTGGRGAAKVDKGGNCKITIADDDLPSFVPGESKTIGYNAPSHSANLSDPVGPGWGGNALLGPGGYAWAGDDWWSSSDPEDWIDDEHWNANEFNDSYGGGGIGTAVTNFWACNGGPFPVGGCAAFLIGSDGAQGVVRIIN